MFGYFPPPQYAIDNHYRLQEVQDAEHHRTEKEKELSEQDRRESTSMAYQQATLYATVQNCLENVNGVPLGRAKDAKACSVIFRRHSTLSTIIIDCCR
jgi:hypothetical protein